MSSVTASAEGTQDMESPIKHEPVDEMIPSSPLPNNEWSSPHDSVYIQLPEKSLQISSMRTTASSSSMFDIDTLGEALLREKRQKQLLAQGFPQREVSRFLSRPCVDRAEELLLAKERPSTTVRGAGSTRSQTYKHLQLDPNASNKNWVLLDPYQPSQLLRGLCISNSHELWRSGEEAAFLHMLQYAEYSVPKPLPITASGSSDVVDDAYPTRSRANTTSTTETEILEHASHMPPRATRIRKHTPSARPFKSQAPNNATPLPPKDVSSVFQFSKNTTNPVDRYLEYNTVSHAVRLRAGFQSRFAKDSQIKHIAYTPNGPRWADSIPDTNGSAEDECPTLVTAKPPCEVPASSLPKKENLPTGVLGRLPQVKKPNTRAGRGGPSRGVFTHGPGREGSIEAEAEGIRRQLSATTPPGSMHSSEETTEDEVGREAGRVVQEGGNEMEMESIEQEGESGGEATMEGEMEEAREDREMQDGASGRGRGYGFTGRRTEIEDSEDSDSSLSEVNSEYLVTPKV
ncbi:Hypothetical protein D9617_17g047130 [Elsinoe fawcettii]|nr:Hypothetical protein D9617_17g047130 [Elsinoe fawcettii]